MVIARERRLTAPSSVPALTWSALAICLGLWWLWQPRRYPFVPGDPATFGTLLGVVPAAAMPLLLVAAGVWGTVVACLAARRQPAQGTTVIVVGTAAVFAVVFGLVVPGIQPLTLVGYAMAMLGPPVLFGVVLAGAWRWRGGPWVVGVLLLVAALAWFTGLADGAVLLRYLDVITTSAERAGPPAVLLFFLVGGLVWGLFGTHTLLRIRVDRPAPVWMQPAAAARWGRVAVVIATVCALPYGLVRLTWLTPWPLGGDAAELADHPEIRLHGLLLGLAALAGAVLTTGLVACWGEVWPRWLPVLRGRPVPVAAAVVPGTLVATLFTVAALPFSVMAVTSGTPGMLLYFPFPVWGPALGAAVLAYALRRRDDMARPGTIDGS
ncbi:hypothetical protein [Pseudonocardia alaniniphila]|uniref:Integral membrane protein n=1 Tax=Pseudonocardia alaniniphila TaxID=75291 RepID=A0ABS9TLG3_9PSEU|nr:hypothetical protein [Pseudonocardia alaniniphila]MCH6169385.1 hypothetical protein [Pseudonocardia alaniniphila]